MLDREELIAEFSTRIIDGMDVDMLARFAQIAIADDLRKQSDADLLAEVAAYYPDLLEE